MFRALVLTLFLSAVFVPAAQGEDSHEQESHVFQAGKIEIIHPWARAAAQGDDSFVFFDLQLKGSSDRLVGAHTDVAEQVHIVGLTVRSDGASYREVGEIDIPAGAFSFDPGGLALELHHLIKALVQGAHFDLVLEFAEAGPVEIEVAIEAMSAVQHSHAGHTH